MTIQKRIGAVLLTLICLRYSNYQSKYEFRSTRVRVDPVSQLLYFFYNQISSETHGILGVGGSEQGMSYVEDNRDEGDDGGRRREGRREGRGERRTEDEIQP